MIFGTGIAKYCLYKERDEYVMDNNSGLVVLNETNFNKEVIESAQPVLVEFVTEWSGACQIIDPIMKQLMEEFKGMVKFCCVDTEKSEGIAEQYGIRDLPTLLFFRKGEVEDHIVGAVSKRVLTGKINSLLL